MTKTATFFLRKLQTQSNLPFTETRKPTTPAVPCESSISSFARFWAFGFKAFGLGLSFPFQVFLSAAHKNQRMHQGSRVKDSLAGTWDGRSFRFE